MALTPSERIHYIKAISERLGVEEWSLIDLTLKQFSLPWTDQWGGDRPSYVMKCLESAADQSLIELAKHVGLVIAGPAQPALNAQFWRPGHFRVFISHLSAHRTVAAELQQEFAKRAITGFVAHNDIEPTLEWQTEIETALATCDALIALLHPDFHGSNWTDQEIGFAMGRGVPVFAVRCGQDPYGFIGRFQGFNGNGKLISTLAEETFDTYRKHKQTQARMNDALVTFFETSNSFAEAKARVRYLEEMTIWDPSFSKRIESAAKSNSQINGSWGVVERVENLIKKWAT